MQTLEPVIVPTNRLFRPQASYCFLCGEWTNEVVAYTVGQTPEEVSVCSVHPILELLQQLYSIMLNQHRRQHA